MPKPPDRTPSPGPYRSEALEHHRNSLSLMGEVRRECPQWVQAAYPLLLSTFFGAILLLVVLHVGVYAEGPAVIRTDGLELVSAAAAGTVRNVAVQADEYVRRGDILVSLDTDDASSSLERLETEFYSQLRAGQLSTTDIVSLRAQMDQARARLEQRHIRSPSSGRIGDLRVRPGQLVNPGETVATVQTGATRYTVLALVPGRFQTEVKPGLEIVLELDGHPNEQQVLRVGTVSDHALGTAEARRVLGADVSDGIDISPPVTLVRAEVPRGIAHSDSGDVHCFDGMRGFAHIRLASRSAIAVLFGRRS